MRTRVTLWVSIALVACTDGGSNGAGTTAASSSSTAVADDAPPPDDGPGPPIETTSTAGDATTASADTTSAPPPDTTGGPAEPGPLVVYVSDGDAEIHLFSADATTGALTEVATYATGPGAAQLALHPDGLHLYATAGGGDDRVITYAIDPATGQLSELGVTPVTISPVYIAIAPSAG